MPRRKFFYTSHHTQNYTTTPYINMSSTWTPTLEEVASAAAEHGYTLVGGAGVRRSERLVKKLAGGAKKSKSKRKSKRKSPKKKSPKRKSPKRKSPKKKSLKRKRKSPKKKSPSARARRRRVLSASAMSGGQSVARARRRRALSGARSARA